MTRLLVYAGPNGSGKSSLRDSGAEADPVSIVIDPDQIARRINATDPRLADRAAGKEALLLFEATLAARQTMSLETTLAGHSVLRRLQAARTAGYEVDLRYIALDFVMLNVYRVQARAASGGHYIEPATVKRRHVSSLANLPTAISIVNRAILTDNSGRTPRPVLEIVERDIIRMAVDVPDWLAMLMPEILAVCNPLRT